VSVSPIALGAAAIGVLLLWSAINDRPLAYAAQQAIKGQSPAGATAAAVPAVTAVAPSAELPGGTYSAGGGTPAANKALGLVMAAAYGWTGTEWSYLESGWQEESGWNQYAANDPSDPYNHAYGIPQANPGSKMASAGSNWESSPATQIKWGLGYIKDEYGSPSKVPGWTPNGPAAGYVGY
jgi:hypothetical protein